MRRSRLFALLALLAASGPACAADCSQAANQMTMNQCADDAFRRVDGDLNALYKQIQGRLRDDAAAAKLLVDAQRAWVGFRDAECRFAASAVAAGSIYPTILSGCAEGLTRKRIGDLKAYLACEEGDLSCPAPAK